MTLQFAALFLVAAGVVLLLWIAWSRFGGAALVSKKSAADGEAIQLLKVDGGDLIERYALYYLQVDALLAEGAQRVGCTTRKIGGLFCEPVEVDSWSLALELFRRDKITFKTYTTFLFCRRIWIRLLAGHHEVVNESHVNRVEKLVEHLAKKLSVPQNLVNQRVTERLEAAGVSI
jgi:hypothetical protein